MSYIKIDLGDNAEAMIREDGSVVISTQESDDNPHLRVDLSYEQMQRLTFPYIGIQHEFTERAMREERGMSYAPKNFPFTRLNIEVHE